MSRLISGPFIMLLVGVIMPSVFVTGCGKGGTRAIGAAPAQLDVAKLRFGPCLPIDQFEIVPIGDRGDCTAEYKDGRLIVKANTLPTMNTLFCSPSGLRRSKHAPEGRRGQRACNFIFEIDVASMRVIGLQFITSETVEGQSGGGLVVDFDVLRANVFPGTCAIEFELLIDGFRGDKGRVQTEVIIRTRGVTFWTDEKVKDTLAVPLPDEPKDIEAYQRRASAAPYKQLDGWSRPRFSFPPAFEADNWRGVVVDLPPEVSAAFAKLLDMHGQDYHEVSIIHGHIFP